MDAAVAGAVPQLRDPADSSLIALTMDATGQVMDESNKRRNLRTALILLSVVAVFFAGVIVNRWLAGG
jgi:uncharacterized membrane protein